MNTIRCLACHELMPRSAYYCPVCGISRISSDQQTDDVWLEIRQSATWHKEVAPSPNRANPIPLPPRPVRARPPMWTTWRRLRYRISSTLVIWISLLVFLLSGGIFGIVATRGSSISKHSNELALQVTPDSVAVGGTVILNGEHFNPHGQIGLTRDTSIPLQDTANATIVEADANGNLTDTIVITPDWNAGPHTINAEDAFRHKVVSFSIMVTGRATSLLPAHLRVSLNTLDLGSGNQATNTIRTITLTNIGGGLISWQGTSTQSWLTLSPTSGTFASGHNIQVMIAIDRSKLDPGAYKGQINIFSTAGNYVVPVKAIVTALTQGNKAGLQVSRALLSFTASDGGPSPSSQMLTVSNLDSHSLQWQATSNADWLFVSPESGTVDAVSNAAVTVKANSSLLLPGTYNGVITLSVYKSGSVVGNPQIIFVTVTIIPQGHPVPGPTQSHPVSPVIQPACTFTVATGNVNLTGISGQAAPINQQIALLVSPSCTNKLNWETTTSGGNWLTASVVGTTTPMVNVSATLAHLISRYYAGSITITAYDSVTGLRVGIPQVIPIALTVQAACTLQTPSSNVEAFDTTTGNKPASQIFIISATGTCYGVVTITPSILYNSGTGWLAAATDTKAIASGESTIFTVTVMPTGLSIGKYEATIQLRGSAGGMTIVSSPQEIDVRLNVGVPPVPTRTPTPSPTPVIVPTPTPMPAPSPTPIPSSTTPAKTPMPVVVTTPTVTTTT